MWTWFWLLLGVLVVAGFLRMRERLRRKRDPGGREPEEAWRASLDPGEPLDMEEVEEEERRFWEEERWDEGEPFQ